MSITIRKAEKRDCPRMMALVRELAAYERAPQEVTVEMQHFEESGFGENPVWQAFVAESETVVTGFALYYIRYSTWKGQRMYLEDLFVTEAARGNGIGKLLFDALVEECKKRNYNGLVWQVLDWNEPAINFYRKYKGVKIEKEWLNCSLNF